MTTTNDNDEQNLEVALDYSKQEDLITLTLSQDDRLIKVGFNLQEAQIFQSQLAEIILFALEYKLGLLPNSPEPQETRH